LIACDYIRTASNGKKVALLTPPRARQIVARLKTDATAKSEQPCIQVKLGGLLWRVRADALDLVKPVCAGVELAIANAPKLYKNSPNVTVASIRSSQPMVVRRMNYGRLRHRLKDLFRASRARRAFDRGLHLERTGLPTPRMLAVAEVRRFRWPVAAYVISDEVPAAQTLAGVSRKPGANLRPLAERLAVIIARLHDCGFVHRDLKASNILIDAAFDPWLIDMDGLQFVKNVTLPQVVRDLRVLATVLNQRPHLRRVALRVLARYCRYRGLWDQCREIAQFVSRDPA
jgi:tRNA A-37 threonylcarbamoyl transferase component Bud32